MRILYALIPLLACLAPPWAQDAAAATPETLAKLAMEAYLRRGDVLREKGDLDAALKEYGLAIEVYGKWRGRAPDVPAPVPDRPAAVAAGQFQGTVNTALKWLVGHQDADGRWDSDEFMKHDPDDDRCDGGGGRAYDVGVTSLALLAFLGAGHTDRDGAHAATVRNGLRFLIASQDTAGVFGPRTSQHWIYNHALATAAMCEAYGLTKNPRYKEPAQRAVDLLLAARNPYLGWRYDIRSGDNDTSVTSVAVLALRSAALAGIPVDPGAFRGALAWVDKMTDAQFGQVGYIMSGGASARPEGLQDAFPPEKTQAMTAAGLVTRALCGDDPQRSEAMKKGAHLLTERLPRWRPDGSIDMYYWFHGTHAMFVMGGPQWRRWSTALQEEIVPHQRRDGAAAGSWDPLGPWGRDGGRVYSTAVMTLTLQIHLRYAQAVKKLDVGAKD